MTPLATDPTLENFGTDPFWLVLLKAVVIFGFVVLMVLFAIVYERKVVAYMQARVGPNRTGPGGWLQSLADGAALTVRTATGSLTLPARIVPMPDGVVWLPANSPGSTVGPTLGVGTGALVEISGGAR